MRDPTADDRTLPPWKAFVGFLACLAGALLAYHQRDYIAACLMSGIAGALGQDWAYRLRDRYDPDREIGADIDG